MDHKPASASPSRRWRRWLPPAVATGTGGTTLAIWFEEIVVLAADFIGVLLMSIFAGIVYLFNFYIFRSSASSTDDLK